MRTNKYWLVRHVYEMIKPVCFLLQGGCAVSTFARGSPLGHNTSKTQFFEIRVLRMWWRCRQLKEEETFLPGHEMIHSPRTQCQMATLIGWGFLVGFLWHSLFTILQVKGKPIEGDVALPQDILLIAWWWCQRSLGWGWRAMLVPSRDLHHHS